MRFKEFITRPELDEVSHPVGNNIKTSIAAGKKMATALFEIFPGKKLRLICAGSSGAILSSIIATVLDPRVIEIVHIKKEGEHSHDPGHGVLTYEDDAINIIVDDFIASGRTIKRIFEGFTGSNFGRKIDAVIVNLTCYKNWIVPPRQEYDIEKLICAKLTL